MTTLSDELCSNLCHEQGGKMADIDGEDYVAPDKVSGAILSAKNVQIDSVLSQGRFAVIQKGTLSRNNERVPVAVKALKGTYKLAISSVSLALKIYIMYRCGRNVTKPKVSCLQMNNCIESNNFN